MGFHTLLWSALSLAGLAGTLGGGFLIVNGPFFGGAVVEPTYLMLALAAFFVGLFSLTLGGSKLVRSRVGY